jgi:hypothetical protein
LLPRSLPPELQQGRTLKPAADDRERIQVAVGSSCRVEGSAAGDPAVGVVGMRPVDGAVAGHDSALSWVFCSLAIGPEVATLVVVQRRRRADLHLVAGAGMTWDWKKTIPFLRQGECEEERKSHWPRSNWLNVTKGSLVDGKSNYGPAWLRLVNPPKQYNEH